MHIISNKIANMLTQWEFKKKNRDKVVSSKLLLLRIRTEIKRESMVSEMLQTFSSYQWTKIAISQTNLTGLIG